MKKTILGLAFLTIASVSFGAMAQDRKGKSECTNTECVSKDKKCAKGDKVKKDRKDRKDRDGKKAAAREFALFEGVNLTTEQQGKIEALNNAVKISRKELKDQAKAARNNGDTTFNVRKAKKDLRSKYVTDLGEILTPDQMTVYLVNYYVNNGGHQKDGKKAMAVKGMKGHKMMKGDRKLDKDQLRKIASEMNAPKIKGGRAAKTQN